MTPSTFVSPESPFGGSTSQEVEPLRKFLRENILILVFGFLGLVFLLVGIVTLNNPKSEESGIIFEESANQVGEKIRVDIEGAVVKPGVYELNSDARIQEALILAGGLSSLADREWVAKSLNLAAKLNDGAKIYIPQAGESRLRQDYGGQVGISAETIGGEININNASMEELDKLPGVGPVTAQKIIDGRPYQSSEDLLNKKIVGASTFSKIKDQITAW